MNDEDHALAAIESTFAVLESRRARFQTATPPATGSVLAEDDLHTSRLLLSEMARQSLAATWDHLDLVKMTIEGRRLFPTAVNSVLRGALVASAQAAWLLGPEDAAVRRERGLIVAGQWYRRRVEFQKNVTAGLKEADRARSLAQIQLLESDGAAAAALRTTKEELQVTSVIRWAAMTVLPDPLRQPAIQEWLRLGGDAHALGWQLMLQDVTWSTPGDPGLQEARIVGSIESVANAYLCAWRFFEYALNRFDELSTPAESNFDREDRDDQRSPIKEL